MMKYVEEKIVFEEIPDCVTLAVTISNCPFHCIGCHSDYLRKNIGETLDEKEIDKLFEKNKGFNCFLFLGDGNNIKELCSLSDYIHKKYTKIKTAVYSGYDEVIEDYAVFFDYIKTGKYIEEYGPLNAQTTNQRLFKKGECGLVDVTYMFWQRK